MSSISANDFRALRRLLSIVLALLAFFPFAAFAQGAASLSMTLTPPLFQLTQAPGSSWSSVIRVVNTNDFDLRVGATVEDFRPDGETGNAVFAHVGVSAPTDTRLMSGWITVPSGDIVIKRGTTGEIPFTISVPIDADPGGHYAAILVGTRGEDGQFSGSGAGVSSAISSLFFLRVPGEVIEEGAIRDFYAKHTMVQSPDALFALRFENKGNVHLVPEGSIVITNMWGKERGKIDINKVNTFGNVLPDSTRKFEFDWHGEANPFEFGRYKALATLVYGENARQSVYRVTYFWVIPWKQVLPLLLGLGAFLWFLTWSIRRYIRNALLLERARLGLPPEPAHPRHGKATPTPAVTLAVLRRPFEEEVRKERALERGGAHGHPRKHRKSWVERHRTVVGFFVVLALGFSLIGWYFAEVFQDERAYQMQQVKGR
jgi:hypothetical protein